MNKSVLALAEAVTLWEPDTEARLKNMLCKYNGCQSRATKYWALAPVCKEHHRLIEQETLTYYNRERVNGQALAPHDRVHLAQVKEHTIFANKN